MIKKLNNTELDISKKIRAVFQVSYKVEAKLLKTKNFPPLKRPLEDYVKSKTTFFGYLKNEDFAGVIEIEHNTTYTYINSLVVDPKYFRQGIGTQLMEYILNTFDSPQFFVETGLANLPASNLYKSFGFKEVKQWDTDHGIRKIKFEKRISN